MRKVIFILLVNIFQVNAQNVLKLDKHKPVYYLTGDKIKLQLMSTGQKVEGKIQSIGNDFIVVNEINIPLSDVGAIYLKRNKFNFIEDGAKMILAGVGWLIISTINSAIISDSLSVPGDALIESSALFAGGIILIRLVNHKVIINNKHSIKVIGP